MDNVRFDRFLDRLRGLSAVSRWNFHHRLTAENVAEHTAYVAIYASILAMMDGVKDDMLLNIVMSAMCHDFEECITGDLPMLVKRDVEGWNRVEDSAMGQLLQFLPGAIATRIGHYKFTRDMEDADVVHKYVKAADIFDVIMYCRMERKLGNTMFMEIEQEASTILRRMNMGSVNIILDAYAYPKFEHSAVELPLEMTHL